MQGGRGGLGLLLCSDTSDLRSSNVSLGNILDSTDCQDTHCHTTSISARAGGAGGGIYLLFISGGGGGGIVVVVV